MALPKPAVVRPDGDDEVPRPGPGDHRHAGGHMIAGPHGGRYEE